MHDHTFERECKLYIPVQPYERIKIENNTIDSKFYVIGLKRGEKHDILKMLAALRATCKLFSDINFMFFVKNKKWTIITKWWLGARQCQIIVLKKRGYHISLN